MYKSGVVLAATALCALASVPAAAAIVGGSNVNLSNGPFTFGPVAADQITLSYPSSGLFADTFVSTTGTAQVSSVFGQPSVDFTDGRGGDVIYGPNAFGAYASFATATDIPYSSTDSFLGLRYTVGNNTYYGYAQFAGADLERYGFETTPNTAVDATAAVPEPASWAMLILGFAGVGFMAYGRKRHRLNLRIA